MTAMTAMTATRIKTSPINLTASSASTQLDPSKHLGIVVSWDYGWTTAAAKADSVAVARDDVAAILAMNGLDADHYLVTVTDEKALTRSYCAIQWGSRCGIRQPVQVIKLKTEKGCPASVGVIVTDTDTEEDARGEVGARVRVEPAGGFTVAPPVHSPMQPEAEVVAKAIADHAEQIASTCFNSELSTMLKRLRRRVAAISMRFNGGGTYFIPAGPDADLYVSVLKALEAATAGMPLEHQFLPHISLINADATNVATWSRNTALSFQAELDELTKTLTDYSSRDNVRDSSFEKARSDCAAMMRRADSVAALLEGKLDGIKSALAKLETQFGTVQEQARVAAVSAATAFSRIAGAVPAAGEVSTATPATAAKPQAGPRAASQAALAALRNFARLD